MVPVRRATTEIAARTGIAAGLAAVRQQDGERAYRILPVRLLPDADLRTPHALVVRQHQPTTMQTRIRARLRLATTRTGTLEPGTQGPAAPPTWRGLTELLRRVPAMSPGVASVLVAKPPEPEPEAKPRPL